MAKGHEGDRYGEARTAVAQYTNMQLLSLLHEMELTRVQQSGAGATREPLTAGWGEGYESLVGEAQRRKLCL